jgi:hypothetical protein
MDFCNPFDRDLFEQGPPAVFLFDRRGALRFDAEWTRDAWGREEGPHARGVRWLLLRDHGTGFVQLVVATSPTLVPSWPRADLRTFASREEAEAVRASFGRPPVVREAW